MAGRVLDADPKLGAIERAFDGAHQVGEVARVLVVLGHAARVRARVVVVVGQKVESRIIEISRWQCRQVDMIEETKEGGEGENLRVGIERARRAAFYKHTEA